MNNVNPLKSSDSFKEKQLVLDVNMSNSLARAAHGLTLNEKRLIATCISKIDSMRSACQFGAGQMKIKVTATEFGDMFDINEKSVFQSLISASDNLMRRYVRFIEKTSKGVKETKFNWVSGVVYHHGEGWVEIGFSHEVTPHLTLLRNEYTGYKLKTTAALRSVYSWRLYELFASFSKKHAFEGALFVTLDAFRHSMEIPVGYKFNDIKRRVIEKSCSEISKIHNLEITWEGKKTGRSISSLSFRFHERTKKP